PVDRVGAEAGDEAAEPAHLPERVLRHVAHAPGGDAAHQPEVDEGPVYGGEDEGAVGRHVLLALDVEAPVEAGDDEDGAPHEAVENHNRLRICSTTSSTVRPVVSMTTASSAGLRGETGRFESRR